MMSKLTPRSGFSMCFSGGRPPSCRDDVHRGIAMQPAAIAKDGTTDTHWVGTWSASPQAASNPVELKDQTIRQIVRVSIGGKRLRVRLSNAFGSSPLVIGAAHVALRSTDAAIAPGSDRVLRFGGAPSTKIPPGALVVSDPVNLQVRDLGDLTISIYVPGDQVASARLRKLEVERETSKKAWWLRSFAGAQDDRFAVRSALA